MTEYKAITVGDGGRLSDYSTDYLDELFSDGWAPHSITPQNVSVSTGSTSGKIKFAPILIILKKEKIEL